MRGGFNQRGSILVILLLMTALLTIFATNIIRNTVFFHDISLKRQEHEYQFRAAEALLNYGIAAAQSHFDDLKNAEEETINFEKWLPEANDGYSGSLSLHRHDQQVQVLATLYRGNSTVKRLSCEVKYATGSGAKVSNWHQLIIQEKAD